MTRVLRWTIERLLVSHEYALELDSSVDASVLGVVDALRRLRNMEPVASSEGVAPERVDLDGLAREGHPWNLLVHVARLLRVFERTIDELAFEILMPDDEFRWRLFHLAILGLVLEEIRELGLEAVSVAPIGGGSPGPAYAVSDGTRKWDLWFEAGGAWTYYGLTSPYMNIVRSLNGANRPLAPDILLIEPDGRALILECKYSRAASYIGTGVAKSMAYALEAQSAMSVEAQSWTVVPDTVVDGPSSTSTQAGEVGLVNASAISGLVDWAVH